MGEEMRQGHKMFAPMFMTANAVDTFKIDDLVVTGYEAYSDGGDGTGGQIIIKALNASGGVAVDDEGNQLMFSYWDNEDTSDDGEGTGAGWYRDGYVSEDTKVTGIVFDAGQAFWVQGVDGLSIQTSGQVKMSEAVIPMRQGHAAGGNPFPTTRDLATTFSVTGYESYADGGDGIGGSVIVKVLTETGAIDIDAEGRPMSWSFWDNEDTSDDGEGTGAGWYRDGYVSEDTKVNDVVIPAGQGLWIQGVDGLYLHIRAPEL